MHPLVYVLVVLSLTRTQGSLYSGADSVCNLGGCHCRGERVQCTCTETSSFQESFVFTDPSRNLRHLSVHDCPGLVFPAQAVTIESQLSSLAVSNVRQLEVHSESLAVSSLRQLSVHSCDQVTFHPSALKPGLTDSALIDINIDSVDKVEVKARAFANIHTFTATNIGHLGLEHRAFQMKVGTDRPTVAIRFVNVSTPSLSSSVFPSSFKSISIENSRIDKIATNAFSGLTISNISFQGSNIQRIERGAFADSAAISVLSFQGCNISSFSQKSVVAGVSSFHLLHSEVQSMAKYGAVNATVADVRIENNRFKTLGTESFQFVAWDKVFIYNNTFDFVEQGAINAIKSPSEDLEATFTFSDNHIVDANMKSLVTQLPGAVVVNVTNNSFGKKCDCNFNRYIDSITGYSPLSNPFQYLTQRLFNSSSCRLSPRDQPCLPTSPYSPLGQYQDLLCQGGPLPDCAKIPEEEEEEEEEEVFVEVILEEQNNNTIAASFYDEFAMLFQVKTTKGILLFLLFCVLCSVGTVTVCVGTVWVHRLCRRAKLPRDHMSGSFQYNSGEEKQALYSGAPSSSMGEPQYAEIAEVHCTPPGAHWDTVASSSPFHTSTMQTTLPSLGATLPMRGEQPSLPSLPSIPSQPMQTSLPSLPTLPSPQPQTGFAVQEQTESLLSHSPTTQSPSRQGSLSETSLTDEIMLALRDKLADPSLYMAVLDAKVVDKDVKEEDLYCAPLYSDPLQLQ